LSSSVARAALERRLFAPDGTEDSHPGLSGRVLFRSDPVSEVEYESKVTLRCPFCATLNNVDFGKSGARPQCGDCAKPLLLDRPVKVAGEDFDRTVLGSQAPVMVDFYADWCAPCKYVAPLMDELAEAHKGALLVAKLDTDQAPELSQRYSIRSIPTVVLFRGGEEVGRSVGFEPEKLRAMAEEAVTSG
jgi:thioredoxin 2